MQNKFGKNVAYHFVLTLIFIMVVLSIVSILFIFLDKTGSAIMSGSMAILISISLSRILGRKT
jgi:uncharacterized PurR-regulated membrane protein YhhQ (DUF165 family)